jgi:hypothetical protein
MSNYYEKYRYGGSNQRGDGYGNPNNPKKPAYFTTSDQDCPVVMIIVGAAMLGTPPS